MNVLLDVILLLALTKEALRLAPSLPQSVWTLFVAVLPFFLGMGGSLRTEPSLLVRNYLRVLIGQGVTLATLLIYLSVLATDGLGSLFTGLFAVVLVFYSLGRLFGLTLRSLYLLFVLVAVMLWLLSGSAIRS